MGEVKYQISNHGGNQKDKKFRPYGGGERRIFLVDPAFSISTKYHHSTTNTFRDIALLGLSILIIFSVLSTLLLHQHYIVLNITITYQEKQVHLNWCRISQVVMGTDKLLFKRHSSGNSIETLTEKHMSFHLFQGSTDFMVLRMSLHILTSQPHRNPQPLQHL